MTANERLKKLVDDGGRKYVWIASKTGLSITAVSDILRGKRELNAAMIEKFCEVLECPASAIIPTPYDNAS